MDRRRRILVNDEERKAHQLLEEALRHQTARLYSKVRIADALDIKQSGLSDEEYSYALKGHFDFLVEPEGQPVAFAIEFDEAYHDASLKAHHNDELKNSICEKLGLPLLRIQINQLQQVGKDTILGWLIELWFLWVAFREDQKSGSVPPDEIFSYSSYLLSSDSDGKIELYPFDPFRHYRDLFHKLLGSHEALTCCGISGTGERSYDEAAVVIYLSNGDAILGRAMCRTFFYPPISASELAEELAIRDVFINYWRYKDGRFKPMSHQEADSLLKDFQQEKGFHGGFSLG
jgi:hypothetical protein